MRMTVGDEHRYYLEDGDRVYSTGCWLEWREAVGGSSEERPTTDEGMVWVFGGWEDDTYFGEEPLEWDDELSRPYIVEN